MLSFPRPQRSLDAVKTSLLSPARCQIVSMVLWLKVLKPVSLQKLIYCSQVSCGITVLITLGTAIVLPEEAQRAFRQMADLERSVGW